MLAKNKFLLCLLVLFNFAIISPIAAAEPSADADTVSIANDKAVVSIDFQSINSKIAEMQSNLLEDSISKSTIDEYTVYLTAQETEIAENRKVLEKHLKFIQKQLDALGEEPKEGETEDPVITKQREELAQKLAAQDRMLKEADLLVIQIEDLTVQILNVRNQKIYGDLITKQSAFINPLVFFRGVKAYVIFFWDVVKSPIEWYKNIPQQDRSVALFNIISFFFILMIALALAIFLRRFILRNWGYKKEISVPHFNRRVLAAISVATARGLIFAFLVGGCILWMISTRIFGNSLLNSILMTTAFAALLAIVEATISRVTFAPYYPQWRLVNVGSDKAIRLTRMIYLFIIFNTIATIQLLVAQQEQYSVETIHFTMIISSAIKAFFLMWFVKIIFSSKDKRSEMYEESTPDDEHLLDNGMKIMLVSDMACIGTFGLSLFGYPELSLFIVNRVIMTMILAGVFEVVRRSFIDILRRIIFSGPWMRGFRSSKKFVAKMDFWLKTIINPIMILVLIFMLLNLWGLPGEFVLLAVKKILFGIKVGGIKISLIAIALGIIVFFGSLTFVRIIKTRLANNVLAKIDMDDGIRHSLISGVGFIGFIISILLAIIAVGIDLTNLAFIAGALSVGIGFGLQDVIKNLVAGIIILLERPFRVGDWVVLNGTEGTIKQINIRSTELQSFSRTSVIIPNATLISSSVTNLTHGDNISRQSVSVGVSYGSNPEQVKEILLECARSSKNVMKSPAPYVLFKDFGSSSLDFELRFYVNDIWKGWVTPSELRYDIFRRFNEAGIEIPFPQIVINKAKESDAPENPELDLENIKNAANKK